MAFISNPNTVRFNATSIGIANFVVASAYTGCTTPEASGVINNKVYQYYAQSPDGTQYEFGFGAYNTTTHTLTRTTIVATSNNDQNIVNFTFVPIVDVYPSPSPLLELTPPTIPTTLYVYFSTSASFSNSTFTVIPFDTVIRDTCSGFSISTHRYTPTIAGDYFFSTSVYVTGAAGTGGWTSLNSINKNSGQVYEGTGTFTFTTSGGMQGISQTSGVVSMNGTTDFVDARVYSQLTSPIISANTSINVFSGFLIH